MGVQKVPLKYKHYWYYNCPFCLLDFTLSIIIIIIIVSWSSKKFHPYSQYIIQTIQKLFSCSSHSPSMETILKEPCQMMHHTKSFNRELRKITNILWKECGWLGLTNRYPLVRLYMFKHFPYWQFISPTHTHLTLNIPSEVVNTNKNEVLPHVLINV